MSFFLSFIELIMFHLKIDRVRMSASKLVSLWHLLLFPWSQNASPSNEPNENHHDSDDQKDVNESAHGVRSDKTQEPEDNQDNCNDLEHLSSALSLFKAADFKEYKADLMSIITQ
jgi:hypothetical protein